MLFGRATVLDTIVRAAGSVADPPLLLVAGPPGAGRTALLAEAAKVVTERGVRISHTRLAPGHRSRPFAALTRLAADAVTLVETGKPGAERTSGEITQRWRSVAGLVAGAAALPAAAERAAGVLAAIVAEAGSAVLLLDDLQWLDPDSLTVLEPLVRHLAGGKIVCVGTISTPLPAAHGVLDRLRAAGLARLLPLRPLNRAQSAALIAQTLQAAPEPALVDGMRTASRGRPGTLLTAVDGYRRTESIRIADRHAYLLRPHQPIVLDEEHELLAPIARLGGGAWAAATALAVLHPLGAVADELAAEALEVDIAELRVELDTLRANGILLPASPTGWRFSVPLVASALQGCLRPFERRRLSQVAVNALWTGRARCADPNYLPDRLADAGRLVDSDRARSELLARAGALMLDSRFLAEHWLRAAAELTSDPALHAHILFLHAATCCIHGEYRRSVRSTTALLHEHVARFDDNALQELEIMHVISLRGLGDTAELGRLAAEADGSVADRPGRRTVTTAAALALLDRWREAAELLANVPDDEWSTDISADLAEIFRSGAELWLGRPQRFDRDLADRGRWRLNDVPRHQLERVQAQARLLLMRGDPQRARQLLATEEIPVERLSTTDQALLAGAIGDWSAAMRLARLSIATGTAPGHEPGHVAMHQLAATILLGSGRPIRARTLLDAAAAAEPVLPHLLDWPAAAVERAFGFPDRAAQRMWDGLKLAADRGFVLGTDLLWFELADLELEAGRPDLARARLAELDRVVELMGGGRPALLGLIVRAAVDGDRTVADQALRLAARRGQPFEWARTVETLVRHGVGDPRQLLTAYDLLDGLRALLHRAWLRNLMREHDIAVPGRRVATVENERLLAELVTEGLSNRQLATVLRASERSVEGRLSRLFSRTGYRSRVELATAMLTGEYSD